MLRLRLRSRRFRRRPSTAPSQSSRTAAPEPPASITDAQDISGLNIGGQLAGTGSLSAGGTDHVTSTTLTSATQASVSTATFAFATSVVAAAGTFAINGTTFSTSTSTTASDIVNMVNAASNQTGVIASYTTGGQISFTTENYGVGSKINVSDASGTVLGGSRDGHLQLEPTPQRRLPSAPPP